jgi:hypothetical protein
MANIYIQDLIDLPEQVSRGDFVLRLTEGVSRPEETLRSYVVTPQLTTCFDQALGLIKSSIGVTPAKQRICTAASAVARAISWRCCTSCWRVTPRPDRSAI